jgi:PAS domain S-box-containing protein
MTTAGDGARPLAVLYVAGTDSDESQSASAWQDDDLHVTTVRDGAAARAKLTEPGAKPADLLVIGAAVEEPLSIAIDLRKAAPTIALLLIVPAAQLDAMVRSLPFCPHLRDARAVDAGAPPGVLRLTIREAASMARRRRTLAELTQQLNSRLRSADDARKPSPGPRYQHLASILAHASDAMLAADFEGLIIASNDAARDLVGGQQAPAGSSALLFETTEGEMAGLIDQARRGTVTKNYETRVRRADASLVDVEVTIGPLYDAEGCVECVSFAVRDTSRRKIVERALIEANVRAEAASRAKSDFLAIMSHELRTPLNAVIGFADIMKSQLFGTLDNPRYLEYAGDIHASGQHLLTLVNRVLDVSRLEAKALELEESDVDMRVLIEECCALVRGQAEAQRTRLAVEIEDGLPRLRGDDLRLRQILLNLLANAVKFTNEDGLVTVRAGIRPSDGAMTLTVSDTGIGMTAQDIARTTEPFARSGNPMVRSREGTGLGLTIVRQLVALHAGSMEFRSAPGRGTTVVISFPGDRVRKQDRDKATPSPE